MASPKILVQILVTGTRIVGKAFFEAGRQAVKNAKQSPQGALGNDVAGVGTANSGSITDQITRQHRMTLDEANLILNIKKGDGIEQTMKNYEHLFKANAPAPKPDKPVSAKLQPPSNSHYLQSKVVRARERIEAELKIAEAPPAEVPAGTTGAGAPPPSPPPPEVPGGSKS